MLRGPPWAALMGALGLLSTKPKILDNFCVVSGVFIGLEALKVAIGEFNGEENDDDKVIVVEFIFIGYV
ncbi:MAG: hypothetical protein FJZ57_00205 [Chlamydiae bacterium]|nr:hypothetical protein [Chlamydiota bacterium]